MKENERITKAQGKRARGVYGPLIPSYAFFLGASPQTPRSSLRSGPRMIVFPVTARRAKRENGGLGEDPPGGTMTYWQVLWTWKMQPVKYEGMKARAKRARGVWASSSTSDSAPSEARQRGIWGGFPGIMMAKIRQPNDSQSYKGMNARKPASPRANRVRGFWGIPPPTPVSEPSLYVITKMQTFN
jgi:hypothetical protein